jgi:lipoprotein NlpI
MSSPIGASCGRKLHQRLDLRFPTGLIARGKEFGQGVRPAVIRTSHQPSLAISIILASLCLGATMAPGDEPDELWRAAELAAAQGEHKRAIELCGEILAQTPQFAEAHYLRGREHFRAGDPNASVRDFDRYLQLRPERAPSLWERGISCYYAKQFEAGAEQFTAYQRFDSTDVENGIWHYLCVSQAQGLDAARKHLLPVKHDPRVPLMEIYAVFQNQGTPDAVLQAANRPAPTPTIATRQRFYAHLYLGLFADVNGQHQDAKRHLTLAVNNHRIDHYMWDVARFHLEQLAEVRQ